ncbi:hypothetical protein B0H13DRAFT_2372468 [Mycena leptocephala]|nr:hypothetical protein B0H13DRAFT_2372468 [Mycena leptocephala]
MQNAGFGPGDAITPLEQALNDISGTTAYGSADFIGPHDAVDVDVGASEVEECFKLAVRPFLCSIGIESPNLPSLWQFIHCSSRRHFLYALGVVREDILRYVFHLRRSHSKGSTNDGFQRTASALTSTRSCVSSRSHHNNSRHCARRLFGNASPSYSRPLVRRLRLAAHDPHPSGDNERHVGLRMDVDESNSPPPCLRQALTYTTILVPRHAVPVRRPRTLDFVQTGSRTSSFGPVQRSSSTSHPIHAASPESGRSSSIQVKAGSVTLTSPSFPPALDPSSALIRAGSGWALRSTGGRTGG